MSAFLKSMGYVLVIVVAYILVAKIMGSEPTVGGLGVAMGVAAIQRIFKLEAAQ